MPRHAGLRKRKYWLEGSEMRRGGPLFSRDFRGSPVREISMVSPEFPNSYSVLEGHMKMPMVWLRFVASLLVMATGCAQENVPSRDIIRRDQEQDRREEAAAERRTWLHRASEADSLDVFSYLIRECRDYGTIHTLAQMRREWYTRTHPDMQAAVQECINEGKITISMTFEQVRASWGEPGDVNRTVTAYGVHSQWVYGSVYVYFDDGILTGWQD